MTDTTSSSATVTSSSEVTGRSADRKPQARVGERHATCRFGTRTSLKKLPWAHFACLSVDGIALRGRTSVSGTRFPQEAPAGFCSCYLWQNFAEHMPLRSRSIRFESERKMRCINTTSIPLRLTERRVCSKSSPPQYPALSCRIIHCWAKHACALLQF